MGYPLYDKIEFIVGDFFKLYDKMIGDAILSHHIHMHMGFDRVLGKYQTLGRR